MSRLYLGSLFVFISFLSFAQPKLKQLVTFADEQYKKGDYYYALSYYRQALQQDSTSVELLWKMAETQRAYKDYVEAEKYYAKVFARDQEQKYPTSILFLGLMQKQNGNYSAAFETMKLAKRRFEGEKGEYWYKKANQEVESAAWAIKNFSDTAQPLKRLPLTVNSYDAEFGHTFRDGKLIFSSLRADSVKEKNQEVYSKTYKTHIYSATVTENGFQKNQVVKDLFNDKISAGNGTFSLDGRRFYFSNCEDEGFNYRCKIMVATYENGKWSRIDSLKGSINQAGKNTTMPHVTRMNGDEVLFFVSDREGGKGALDIWYAKWKDGRFLDPIAVNSINSEDNELTPWYDTLENKLYFSSSWHFGFGGQDVFFSTNKNGKFTPPVNAGLPINSPANDQYFFKHKDTLLVSTNRIGSYYAKNPTCCSDIFAYFPPKKVEEVKKIEEVKVVEEVKKKELTENQKRIKQRLPVTLYFRNDEPDASSWATTTKQNYLNTYQLYVGRYDYYKTELAKGLAPDVAQKRVADLSCFFSDNVDKGAKDLIMLTEMIKAELELGSAVTLFIKGFASPVAKTDYNVNLTKRRISSLINFFNEYNNGELKNYVSGTADNGGKLTFTFAPFGEYTADQTTSDNTKDQSNSVFSKEAGIERKIQIENISFDKDEKIFPFLCQNPVFTAGTVKKGDLITGTFTINNIMTDKQTFELVSNSKDLTVSSKTYTVDGFSKAIIQFTLKTTDLNGLNKQSFLLKVNGFEVNSEFFITSEVK